MSEKSYRGQVVKSAETELRLLRNFAGVLQKTNSCPHCFQWNPRKLYISRKATKGKIR